MMLKSSAHPASTCAMNPFDLPPPLQYEVYRAYTRNPDGTLKLRFLNSMRAAAPSLTDDTVKPLNGTWGRMQILAAGNADVRKLKVYRDSAYIFDDDRSMTVAQFTTYSGQMPEVIFRDRKVSTDLVWFVCRLVCLGWPHIDPKTIHLRWGLDTPKTQRQSFIEYVRKIHT